MADLEALRVIRHYLIFEAKNRGYAYDRLIIAIDDYAGEITGDPTALHAKPAGIPGTRKPIVTLRDAVKYMTSLPRAEQNAEYWRPAFHQQAFATRESQK